MQDGLKEGPRHLVEAGSLFDGVVGPGSGLILCCLGAALRDERGVGYKEAALVKVAVDAALGQARIPLHKVPYFV